MELVKNLKEFGMISYDDILLATANKDASISAYVLGIQ